MPSEVTSLRLPKNMEVELTTIARADGNSIAEAMREALAQYIVSRRSDPQFKERLRERLDEDREVREVMERLAK